MKACAAILVELGKPLEVVDLDIPPLLHGQVLVEVAYSGVCHTQLLEARGFRGEDRFLPHCLGHEGTGTVMEVGSGVTKVQSGDRVVLSWIKGRGAEVSGTRYKVAGTEQIVNAGGVTTFNRMAVVSENRLTRLDPQSPMDMAALLGCAIPTGVGAVVNAARAQPGQSMAVFGCGGVGLCSIIGARVSGCSPIVAVDVLSDKLKLAVKLGATHVICATGNDVANEVANVVAGGVDIAVEATGRPAVMRDALRSVRPRGGIAVVVGNARAGEMLCIEPQQLNMGKRLIGTWGGDSDPDVDYPRFAEMLTSARDAFREIISGRMYRLEDANSALDDLEGGRCVRPIIELGT